MIKYKELKPLRAWDFAIKYFEVKTLQKGFDDDSTKIEGAKMALILNNRKNGKGRFYRKSNSIANEIKTINNEREFRKIYDEYLSRGWDEILDEIVKYKIETYCGKSSNEYNNIKFEVADFIANNFGIDCLHTNYRKWYERKLMKVKTC